MINNLKMTVLIDNIASEPLCAEWGLSIFIEADNNKILLDTGASELFAKNAQLLNISLDKEKKLCYSIPCSAGVAHPVERHLAKVEVASSSLVARSIKPVVETTGFFLFYAPVMELVDMRDLGSRAKSVGVRVPSGAPKKELILKGWALFWCTYGAKIRFAQFC